MGSTRVPPDRGGPREAHFTDRCVVLRSERMRWKNHWGHQGHGHRLCVWRWDDILDKFLTFRSLRSKHSIEGWETISKNRELWNSLKASFIHYTHEYARKNANNDREYFPSVTDNP